MVDAAALFGFTVFFCLLDWRAFARGLVARMAFALRDKFTRSVFA